MSLALTIAMVLAGLAATAWAIRLTVRGPRLPAIPLAYLGVIALAWVALVSWSSDGYRPRPVPDELAGSRPTEEPIDDYVTSDTCRSCHPGEHQSWHASYHRTMTQVATEDSVKGDFDSGHLAEFSGMTVRFSRDDEGFWATYAFPNSAGTGYRAVEKRRIVMTTGSHHYQVYWTDQPWDADEFAGDRTVWLVPSVYLFDEQQWVPRQASFLISPTDQPESAQWNKSCLRCHATHGIRRNDTGGNIHDTRTVEYGISCEACHGPGRAHVEANRDPLRRYRLRKAGEGDPTIVNPARLDKKRNADTCGQCHSVVGPDGTEMARKWRLEGRSYRPGLDLDEHCLIMQPGEKKTALYQELFPGFFDDRFWSDGMVRVAGREYHGLLNTPCFQRGEMTCLSCHSMHKSSADPRDDATWANDQLGLGMRGNAACTQCHDSFSDPEILANHTHHAAGSSGSNCYNCHMPHTSYGLLKGIRSHQIDSPSVTVELDTGRPNACNLCHLDKTLDWTAGYLQAWYGQPKPALSEDESGIAASVLWMLTGDAGKRALAASALGRPEPRAASGTAWMPPFLALLHSDPYHAVQIIANKSLRTIEGFAGVPRYPDTPAGGENAYQLWNNSMDPRRENRALLLDAGGRIDQAEMRRLLDRRDHTPVNLKE